MNRLWALRSREKAASLISEQVIAATERYGDACTILRIQSIQVVAELRRRLFSNRYRFRGCSHTISPHPAYRNDTSSMTGISHNSRSAGARRLAGTLYGRAVFTIGDDPAKWKRKLRSEEHTSELQSLRHLV